MWYYLYKLPRRFWFMCILHNIYRLPIIRTIIKWMYIVLFCVGQDGIHIAVRNSTCTLCNKTIKELPKQYKVSEKYNEGNTFAEYWNKICQTYDLSVICKKCHAVYKGIQSSLY